MVRREQAQIPVLWEVVAITSLAIIYGVARLFLLVEAFIELRDTKATAFVNVEWTNFIPRV